MVWTYISDGGIKKCVQNFEKRPRRKWEDNIEIDPRKVVYVGVKRIELFQYTV
jgi:hypothetical protein